MISMLHSLFPFDAFLLADAGKTAIGWVVVLIGLALGIVAVVFPGKRKSPSGEEDEPAKKKKKK